MQPNRVTTPGSYAQNITSEIKNPAPMPSGNSRQATEYKSDKNISEGCDRVSGPFATLQYEMLSLNFRAAVLGCAILSGNACAADLNEVLDGLSRSASTFSLTAPGLIATETLHQRGRHGVVDLLRRAKPGDLRKSRIRLPQDFREHRVVSSWTLAPFGEARVLHEVRRVESFDGRAVAGAAEARHALTAGLISADDRAKRMLLEDFDSQELEGTVVDFGQLLLLFEQSRRNDYSFSASGEDRIGDEAVVKIAYRQVGGDEGLTVFRERSEEKHPARGEIWLRASDWIPLRITLGIEERLSALYMVRTEAAVDYLPSRLGLIPSTVTYRQFLNADLVVENEMKYSDFQRADRMIP